MPTNTTAMTYDMTRHLYVLELDYLKNTLGIDLISREGSATKARDKAYQVSRTIYNYIYNYHLKNKRFYEHYLATVDDVRPVIQTALEEQMRYEWESSVSKLDLQIGINFLNGVTISKNDLRGERRIALEAENALRFYANGALINTSKEYLPFADSEFDYTTMGY